MTRRSGSVFDVSRACLALLLLCLGPRKAGSVDFDLAAAIEQARVAGRRLPAGESSAVVQLPSGPWSTPPGPSAISVQPGESLLLQGQPSDASSAAVKASQWQLGSAGAGPLFALAEGSQLAVSDLGLLDVELAPSGSDSKLNLPPLVQLAGPNSTGTLVLRRCTLLLRSCAALRQLQNQQCRLQLEDSSGSSPQAEVEADWLMIWHLVQPGLELDSCALACQWPPPPLLTNSSSSSSASPSSADPTPLWQHPAFNASFVRVSSLGSLEPDSPLLPPPPSLDQAGTGNSSSSSSWGAALACVSRRVGSVHEVQRALLELQPLSGQVVLQVVRNISLASAPLSADNSSQAAGEQWPSPGRALRVYRNVTLLGRQDVELDFYLHRFMLYLDNTSAAVLQLANLVLANVPTGPRRAFPATVLLAMLWPIAMDRSPSARVSVRVVNCTLVVPDDTFAYTSYWTGLAASPIPSIRALASWQDTLALQGGLEYRIDSHKLRVQQRDGQGITWVNMAITERPFWSPRRLLQSGIGALVPGDPLYPWAKITPVFSEEQLVLYMQAPAQPYALLLSNISLTPYSIQQAGSNTSAYRQAGLALDSNTTTTNEQQARSARQQLQAAGNQLVVGSSLTLLGDWQRPTVLDLGAASGLVLLGGAGEQRPQVSLQRLLLSGLGPASPPQPPTDLANYTVNLWAFSFNRQQTRLLLNNTTLLLPEPELGALRDLLAADAVSAPLALASREEAGAGAFAQAWVSSFQLPGSSPDSLAVSSITYSGVMASNLSLVSRLPFSPTGLNITASRQDLVLGGPGGGLGLAELVAGQQPGPGQSHHRWLPWQVGLLAAGCSVALLALAGAGLWVRRHQLQRNRMQHAVQEGEEFDERRKSMQQPKLHVMVPSNNTTDGTPSTSSLQAPCTSLSAAGSPLPTLRAPSLAPPPPSSLRTLSRSTRPEGDGASGGPASSLGSMAPSLSGPDDEIRQLVSAQRSKKRRAGAGGASSQGFDLDGVQLDEVLGQGSYGVVYRGRWRGMAVAVKALMFHDAGPTARRARQRAVNEAAINTLLAHDCICNMYAYDLRPMAPTGLPDDKFSAHYRLYIIQEYCDAGTLAHAIDNGLFGNPLTGTRKLPHILQAALDIAQGLAYIHSKDVIHGDLSSGNIMLRTDPSNPLGVQAKVCDFGLSRFLEGPDQSHISNARQGTPYYMAPEVLAHGLMSREADAFSFGVILWELFHVQPPPWRDPEVLRAAAERLNLGSSTALIPPKAMVAALHDVGPSALFTTTAGGSCLAGDGTAGSIMLPRPMLLLDATNPSGFTFPLPPGCPQTYSDLVAACIHPIPKVRPRLSDAVEVLVQLQRSLGLPSLVRGEGRPPTRFPSLPPYTPSLSQQGTGRTATTSSTPRLAATPELSPIYSSGPGQSGDSKASAQGPGLLPHLPRAASAQPLFGGVAHEVAAQGAQPVMQVQGVTRTCSALGLRGHPPGVGPPTQPLQPGRLGGQEAVWPQQQQQQQQLWPVIQIDHPYAQPSAATQSQTFDGQGYAAALNTTDLYTSFNLQ